MIRITAMSLIATIALPVCSFADSCIVSGSTVRDPVSIETADPLGVLETRNRTILAATPLPVFESRIFTSLADILQEFRSDARQPFVLFVR